MNKHVRKVLVLVVVGLIFDANEVLQWVGPTREGE